MSLYRATIGIAAALSLTGCAALYRVGLKPPDRFGGPQPGETAPDFTLATLDGREVTLSNEWKERPLALVLGSYSCPAFRGWTEGLEKLRERHGERASFYILYTIEAHPEGSASPYRPGREWVTRFNRRENVLVQQPDTNRQRQRLAGACRSALDLEVPILVDEMDNRAWEAYGSAPNAAYLIDTDGKVVARQGWFYPPALERSLESHLARSR